MAPIVGGMVTTQDTKSEELRADAKLLRDVGAEFACANTNLYADGVTTAELAAHMDQTSALLNRITQKHAGAGDSDELRSLRTAAEYLSTELRRFKTTTKAFATDFSKEFDSVMLIASRQLEDALRSRSPGLFDSARQSLVRAADIARIQAALVGSADTGVQKALRRIDDLRNSVVAKGEEIRAGAIEQVRPPEDIYAGADKDDLLRLIRESWSREYPEDTVVDVRLPCLRWESEPRIRWHDAMDTWRITDVQRLCARVIVQRDEHAATIFAANVLRESGGEGPRVDARTKTIDYPIQDVLLERVR